MVKPIFHGMQMYRDSIEMTVDCNGKYWVSFSCNPRSLVGFHMRREDFDDQISLFNPMRKLRINRCRYRYLYPWTYPCPHLNRSQTRSPLTPLLTRLRELVSTGKKETERKLQGVYPLHLLQG